MPPSCSCASRGQTVLVDAFWKQFSRMVTHVESPSARAGGACPCQTATLCRGVGVGEWRVSTGAGWVGCQLSTETSVLARQPRTLSTLCFLRLPAAAYDVLKALDRTPASETFPSAQLVGRRPSQHQANETFPTMHVPSEIIQTHCRRREKTLHARGVCVPMSN